MTHTDDTPAERCNALALRQATRHVSQLYDQHLAATGLKGTQFSIVARLAIGGPRSINDLARELVMDRTTLGRNLRPLERDGLVALEVDPDDRRSRRLSVTARGAALYERARPAWKAAQQRFEKSFGKERAAALRALMRSITQTDLSGS
jgi:DNA-binding MarR family transcriptional regulator